MLEKIVLTGAAGALGNALRQQLSQMARVLVSTDIAEAPGPLFANETWVSADLGALQPVVDICEGADMIVHFGAIANESDFDSILHSNFRGTYNIWEAARQHGVRRVVYASSIHAVGMHPKNACIGVDAPHRPDTFYGLAKCFGENLGRMYWEKNGIEAVCLRILSAAPVRSTRALGTWLSTPDLIRLVTRAVDTSTTEFTIIYGVSNNDRSPVDNSGAAYLGYKPQDNAEDFADEIFAKAPPADPLDPAQTRLAGPFATIPFGNKVDLSNMSGSQKKD